MATSGNKSIHVRLKPRQHTQVCIPFPVDLLKPDLAHGVIILNFSI